MTYHVRVTDEYNQSFHVETDNYSEVVNIIKGWLIMYDGSSDPFIEIVIQMDKK